MERRFLFICGAARSGTSALWGLVSSHPKVGIGVERYIVRALSNEFISPELFEKERFFSVEQGDTFYADLQAFHPRYAELERRYDDCVYLGDKVPRLYEHYERLWQTFNKPKIIFIVRNVLEVAASYQRRAKEGKHWSERRDYRSAVTDWNRSLAETRAHMRDKNILVVEFESIFRDIAYGRRVFDYLELDWDPAVAKEYAAAAKMAQSLSATRASKFPLGSHEIRHICMTGDFSGYRDVLHSASSLGLLAGGPLSRGKYQAEDYQIVNYRLYELAGTRRFLFRGPKPKHVEEGEYVACLGGAQTFGRFVENPYPSLLQAATGVDFLNLGIGDGKPAFYLHAKGLLEYLNRARAVVVQVFSARAVANSRFQPADIDNSFLKDKTAGQDAKSVFADHAYSALLKQLDKPSVRRIVAETRRNYLSQMQDLLSLIKPPKILFWFSVRDPDYTESLDSAASLLGEYPHFVNRDMLEQLKPFADEFVACVSRQGLPQKLLSRFDGSEVGALKTDRPSENTYYPSPEMHRLAASALLQSHVLKSTFASVKNSLQQASGNATAQE